MRTKPGKHLKTFFSLHQYIQGRHKLDKLGFRMQLKIGEHMIVKKLKIVKIVKNKSSMLLPFFILQVLHDHKRP